MRRSNKHPSKQPGLPPGTLVHVGKKRKGKVTVELIDYDEEGYREKKVTDVTTLRGLLDSSSVSWINVNGLHDVELLGKLGETFSINPLVMEDILNTRQRPKVEFFPDYVFITTKMVKLDRDRMGDIEQVSLILGKGFVISFQEWKGDVFDPIRDRIRSHRGKIREKGSDYLAYALLDSIVDNYFPVLGSLSDEMDRIEETLRKELNEKDLNRIHSIRRNIVSLKRAIWPLREGISNLMREESPLIREDVHPFLRDVYDHTIQVMDHVDSMRDVSTGLMELYVSLTSNRMNEIMKVLTIIATIFIPLTFIAGIYGMNFNPDSSPLNMPELEWYVGYPLVMFVMLMIAIGMVIYFKRKRWF